MLDSGGPVKEGGTSAKKLGRDPQVGDNASSMSRAEDVRTSFLPAVYHGADRAATSTRRRYMRLVGANLALVLTVAVVASVSLRSTDARRMQAVITAAAFAASLALTLATSAAKYDRLWVTLRAQAESIKSSAWRFAMAASPFDMSTPEAERTLLTHLQTTASEAPAVGLARGVDRPAVTEAMVALRHAALDVRRERYVADRIAEQRDWFADKAAAAARAGRTWGTLLVIAQVAGFASALIAVWDPGVPFNGRAACAAFAAASLGWLRATQHRELAASYTAMRQALEIAGESARRAGTEDVLGAAVAETEAALERENGAWVQRRSVM